MSTRVQQSASLSFFSVSFTSSPLIPRPLSALVVLPRHASTVNWGRVEDSAKAGDRYEEEEWVETGRKEWRGRINGTTENYSSWRRCMRMLSTMTHVAYWYAHYCIGLRHVVCAVSPIFLLWSNIAWALRDIIAIVETCPVKKLTTTAQNDSLKRRQWKLAIMCYSRCTL